MSTPSIRSLCKRGLARQKVDPTLPVCWSYKLITKSGKERWIQVRPSYFEYSGKPATIATVVPPVALAFFGIILKQAYSIITRWERRISVKAFEKRDGNPAPPLFRTPPPFYLVWRYLPMVMISASFVPS